jgi:hypothetical protein
VATNVFQLYRERPSHPQTQVCATCEVRRSALFGALDESALDRIHEHIADIEIQPDEKIYRRADRVHDPLRHRQVRASHRSG